MNRFLAAAILAFTMYVPSGFLHAASMEVSSSEYIAALNSLSGEVAKHRTEQKAILEISSHLPAYWIVHVEKGRFRVDSGIVTEGLRQLAQNKSEQDYQSAQNRISILRSGALAYQYPADSRYPSYRSTLSSILARPDFRKAHGPTWWDALSEKLQRLFLSLLEFIFGRAGSMADALAWSIIIIAVIFLGFIAIRMIRKNVELESVAFGPTAAAAATGNASLADARKAAENGEWREAIRLSYWTGIFFLESEGLWRPDNARTPREYLRLALASAHHNDLSYLTRQFEAVWYGRTEAGPAIFSEFMSCLERIGCHSS